MAQFSPGESCERCKMMATYVTRMLLLAGCSAAGGAWKLASKEFFYENKTYWLQKRSASECAAFHQKLSSSKTFPFS